MGWGLNIRILLTTKCTKNTEVSLRKILSFKLMMRAFPAASATQARQVGLSAAIFLQAITLEAKRISASIPNASVRFPTAQALSVFRYQPTLQAAASLAQLHGSSNLPTMPAHSRKPSIPA